MTTFPVGTVVDTYDRAVLSEVDTAFGRVQLLRVAGEPFDMGYQYGRLVGEQIPETWRSLMDYLGKEMGMSGEQAERLLGPLLDRAYNHLEPYVAREFQDEMEGILDGAMSKGVSYVGSGGTDLRSVLQRSIALSNTSDLNALNAGAEAVAKITVTGTSAELDAYYQSQARLNRMPARTPESKAGRMLGRTCSFFAVWGERADSRKLFGSRNLDWSTDTGISNQALVSVYRPNDGHAYGTFGFAGLIGALAGLNDAGIILSEVGSNSVLEKLKGEPWTLKFREILAQAEDLGDAIPLMVNQAPDRVNRPTTIGYNFMVGFGDPHGQGANAAAAVFETNGGLTYMSHRDPTCAESARLYSYSRDGRVRQVYDPGSSPQVNLERSAMEIDAEGSVRTFRYENGSFTRDSEGFLIEDPYGLPIQTGKYIPCTLYRGDEALGYGVRRWQTAANGPSGDDPREVMIDSGSWNHRYSTMHGMLEALWSGTSYRQESTTWVESGTALRTVDLDRATDIARAAAMDSNIMSVVYDATGLRVRLAYESGSGATWTRAADNDYIEIDMAAVFNWD